MSVLKRRRLIMGSFVAYCIALFVILFLRQIGGQYDFSGYSYWQRVADRFNPVPFATLKGQLHSVFVSSHGRSVAARNLAANLLLFAPMGVFLPLLWAKLRRFRICITLWTGLILAVEIIQLLSLQGSFDIDDVILNTLGFLAGFCVFLILKIFTREEN